MKCCSKGTHRNKVTGNCEKRFPKNKLTKLHKQIEHLEDTKIILM